MQGCRRLRTRRGWGCEGDATCTERNEKNHVTHGLKWRHMAKKRIHFSVAGLEKKSFALPFRGGMIWYEHLDSLGEDEAAFRAKLAGDCAALSRPSAPALLAVVLDETDVTDACSEQLAAVLTGQAHPKRVAFVGASAGERRRIGARLGKLEVRFAVAFFDDLEAAKGWLVP